MTSACQPDRFLPDIDPSCWTARNARPAADRPASVRRMRQISDLADGLLQISPGLLFFRQLVLQSAKLFVLPANGVMCADQIGIEPRLVIQQRSDRRVDFV